VFFVQERRKWFVFSYIGNEFIPFLAVIGTDAFLFSSDEFGRIVATFSTRVMSDGITELNLGRTRIRLLSDASNANGRGQFSISRQRFRTDERTNGMDFVFGLSDSYICMSG